MSSLSFVYILINKARTRLKIGKANDIARRAEAFDSSQLDLSLCFALEVGGEPAARNVERALQRTFHKFRLSAEFVIAEGGRVEGATEWFDFGAYEALCQYIQAHAKLMDYSVRDATVVESMFAQYAKSAVRSRPRNMHKRKKLLRASIEASQELGASERSYLAEQAAILSRMHKATTFLVLAPLDGGARSVLVGSVPQNRRSALDRHVQQLLHNSQLERESGATGRFQCWRTVSRATESGADFIIEVDNQTRVSESAPGLTIPGWHAPLPTHLEAQTLAVYLALCGNS